jgi:ribosomal protein S18 acetylase RimI-like enzyme
MNLTFSTAALSDAPALVALHNAVSADLTLRFGRGHWTSVSTEKGVHFRMRHTIIVIARNRRTIVGTLSLQTKKPWAIDVSYFTPVKKSLYLTNMAVLPAMQRQGLGRRLLAEAVKRTRAFPANAIRLDAFDAEAGAGSFYAKCDFREVARVTYRNNPLIYFELLV